MSLKSAPYYWVTCDNCGQRCDYGDYESLSSQDDAVQMAIEADWTKRGDRHHCPDCPPLDVAETGQ